MLQKLIATAALTLALSLPAIAQDNNATGAGNAGDDSSETTGATDPMPQGWEGPIADTFYSDMSARTLREEADMATRWTALSAGQQAQVKSDCAGMSANADDSVKRACEWAGQQ